ncbi:hypothetical protein OAS39_07200 [Pirellulales bacterium]|nr:hypothetical protein [Pirellulales bacterium]
MKYSRWYIGILVGVLIIAFMYSINSRDRVDPRIRQRDRTVESAVEIAKGEFEAAKLGHLADYNVKDISSEGSDVWLVVFSLKDLANAQPGSDIVLAIDKSSNTITSVSD